MTDPNTPELEVPQTEDGPAPKPRRRRSPAAKAAVAETAGEPAAQAPGEGAETPEQAARDTAPAVVAHEGTPDAQPGPADDAAGPQRDNGSRKRNRNRRRNRRGGGRDGARGTLADPAGESGGEAAAESVPAVNLPVTDVNELFSAVVSGDYDTEEPEATALPAGEPAAEESRRVLLPQPDAPKLQKVLAQSGIASRRDLEQMISAGRVAVNGQPAHIGQRIKFGDRIAVDGKPVRVRITPPAPRVLAYHKPVGEVVTHDDPQARPTVFRRLPRLPHGKWQSVGRLDINTEGLLLFTNSGDLANRLMHPRFGVEREYAVRVLGTLTDEEHDQLLQGVDIDGQTASFKSIADGGGEGVNHWYRVVITEGRNREVRKLFDSVDKAVSRLIRIRYGSVVLPRGLKRGVWVDLGADDLKALRMATGIPQREKRPEPQRERQPGPRRGAAGAPGDVEADRRGRRGRRRGHQQGPNIPAALEGILPRAAEPEYHGDEESDNHGPIPNPLQQTYDKRAIQQARKPQREYGDDGPIPNPLQQTYDKRAVQGERKPRREFSEDGPIPNPLQQTYDKRFAGHAKAGTQGAGGGARRKSGGRRKAAPGAGGGGQPDPMRTAVGYIGGDAFMNKLRGAGGRGGKGGRRGGGGGGGGRGR